MNDINTLPGKIVPDMRSEEMKQRNMSGYHEHKCQYNQAQITLTAECEPVQVPRRQTGTFLNKKEIIFFSSQQHNRQQHRLHTG